MDYISRNIENSGAVVNVIFRVLTQNGPKEDNVSIWPRDYSCHNLSRMWILSALVPKKYAYD